MLCGLFGVPAIENVMFVCSDEARAGGDEDEESCTGMGMRVGHMLYQGRTVRGTSVHGIRDTVYM